VATPEGRAPIPTQLNSSGALAFWGAVILTGAGAGIGAALLTRLLQWVQHLMWPGPDLLDAAAVGEGGAASFFRRHAGGDALIGEEVGVGADFGVESMLDLLFVEQVAECGAEPGTESGCRGHSDSP